MPAGGGMDNGAYFREKAQLCRNLLKVATDPEVIAQLKEWAVEFDREADRADTRARKSPPKR
jgi:hypothetical protein